MIGAKERRLQLVVAKFPEATRMRVRGCREAAMGRGVREALTGWRSDPHFGVVTSVCQPAGDVPGSTLGPLREILPHMFIASQCGDVSPARVFSLWAMIYDTNIDRTWGSRVGHQTSNTISTKAATRIGPDEGRCAGAELGGAQLVGERFVVT